MSYHNFVCPTCQNSENRVDCETCNGSGGRGSFEVFHRGAHCPAHETGSASCHECAMNAGWYWWACFPGCLPDGDEFGPFATEQAAINDANAYD